VGRTTIKPAYGDGNATAIDFIMSRLSSISDNQSGASVDAAYTYLGTGRCLLHLKCSQIRFNTFSM
jgi:hypothetical protein